MLSFVLSGALLPVSTLPFFCYCLCPPPLPLLVDMVSPGQWWGDWCPFSAITPPYGNVESALFGSKPRKIIRRYRCSIKWEFYFYSSSCRASGVYVNDDQSRMWRSASIIIFKRDGFFEFFTSSSGIFDLWLITVISLPLLHSREVKLFCSKISYMECNPKLKIVLHCLQF